MWIRLFGGSERTAKPLNWFECSYLGLWTLITLHSPAPQKSLPVRLIFKPSRWCGFNCRNTVNLCKWASWSEWVITDFLPLGVTASSRFCIPLLSLNLHMTRGIYYKRVEGKGNIALFLWSRVMAGKEHTGRIKPLSVNSASQLWPTFSKLSTLSKLSVIKTLGKEL